MRQAIISPLLTDTIRLHRHMKVLVPLKKFIDEGDGLYWQDISSIFSRDPMKPGKWFYQFKKGEFFVPARLSSHQFAIETEWFKKYFTKTYIVKMTDEQQRAYITLNRRFENKADKYFKKAFTDAGIIDYLFLLGPYDSSIQGIGFLSETDAVLGQNFVDQMEWDYEEDEW